MVTPSQPGDNENTLTNTRSYFRVSRTDLPLHCPMPGTSLWDSHPRVFLPIEDEGESVCPYCGTRYVLVDALSR